MAYPVEIPDPKLRTGALLAVSLLPLIWAVMAFIMDSEADNVYIDSLVYVNTDPVESLIRLPGAGVGTAKNIIDYRQSSGKQRAFENIDDLCEVKGIAEKKAQIMAPYVSFE